MKTKMLLLASVFTLGLVSCSNNDVVEKGTMLVDADLKLRLDIKGIEAATRAKDTAAEAGQKSSIQSVDIYLLTPSAVHSSYTVSSADLTALTDGTGYVLQKVNGNVEGVAIVANKNHTGDRVANGTPITELKKLALATDIKSVQPDAANPGIKNAQMYGVAQNITDSGEQNAVTGNNIFVANVQLLPAIARVQVYGEMKHSVGITELKVNKIFLDNLYTNSGKLENTDKFQVETNVDPKLTELLKGVGIFDMDDAGLPMFATKAAGVYAYHIFPQAAVTASKPKNSNVKLILEVSYKYTDPSGAVVSKTEYPTLRLATATGNTLNPDAINIQAAKIYSINLGKIDWTGNGEYVEPGTPGVDDEEFDEFTPGDGGETPNEDQKDLKVIVEIQEWEEIEIIPQN